MQLRCTYCQTMFSISREETLAGLEHMDEEHLKYYDAHCPKCRRANRVERFKLEFSYPGWREAIKEMAKAAPMIEEMPAGTQAPAAEIANVQTAPKKQVEKAAPVMKKAKPAVRAAAKKAVSTPARAKAVSKTTKTTASKGKPTPKSKAPAKATKKK
jgi:hypothetical protein